MDAAIGLSCEKDNFGSWPGEAPRSIGWGSDGLQVNGVPIDGAAGILFKNGDVLGCGMETGVTKRVFFTYNSNLVIPPSSSTDFLGGETRNCFPTIAFRYGTSRNIVKANFGMDATAPFRWKNTEGTSILSQQPGGSAYSRTSFDSLPAYQQDTMEASRRASNGGDISSSRSRSPSPYYSISEMPTSPMRDPIQTRSASYAMGGGVPTPDAVSPRYNVSAGGSSSMAQSRANNYGEYANNMGRHTEQKVHSPPPQPPSNSPTTNAPLPRGSYYGTRNNKRSSLVDDDPSAVSLTEHLTLPTQQQSASAQINASLSGSEHRRQQHRVTRNSRRARSNRAQSPVAQAQSPGPHVRNASHISLGSQHGSPPGGMSHSPLMGLPPTHSLPRNDDLRSHTDAPEPALIRTDSKLKQDETPEDRAFRPGAVSVSASSPAAAAQDILGEAKMRSKKLAKAARENEMNAETLAEMLEACKKDQEALQLKLNHALEQSDSIENLEELFGVNDGICTAIELGTSAVKRAKERMKKKKKVEGPTIELLVENEDVFSLICMLRAANEKRLEAAIALMKFARDSDRLRNEIRSSGGMHSFLTLVRTNGIVRELKIVGALAVAYVVPNFVLSSQTSSSVGLKIMECLRFLVDSQGISVNDISITQVEMCKAASVGVTFLWINSIQPLLLVSKDKGDKAPGTPNRSTLARFGRQRSRIGGGTFDQGQESLEVKELSELAVSLVVRLAHISDSGGFGSEMGFGYNIVEQVCEVDAARPIAVREGLMRLLVDWIISKDVDKVRPAASALRYLISIEDKYMAGWIHSQVVNEGAVAEIVKLLNESVGHDVRVAVAEMLSALCCAPHTRAAVVEAKCVSYLVALLYEHTSPASEQMVHYAGSALLQLAAGALTRASALAGSNLIMTESAPNKHETVVNEILEGWAHGSFVQIALEHRGKLRSVSVEALRVLSEDTDPVRQTRLQLCGAGAGEALGKTLGAEISDIRSLANPNTEATQSLHPAAKDIHEALRGLANILEPQKELKSSRRSSSANRRLSHAHVLDAKDSLIKGCLDTVRSGGLDGLIWASSLPYTPCLVRSQESSAAIDRMDLVDESCRLLANLSSLLLTDTAASNGCAKWATPFFESLDGLLKRSNDGDSVSDHCAELNIDALVGIGALAFYEPLKIRIVDKTLPKLLFLKSLSGERIEVANAASQVLLSLGFTEDEITVQVAGNNPKLLVDWFCLQRALIIQAMARTEIRTKVMDMWQAPFAETNIGSESSMKLMRQLSAQSVVSTGSGEDKSGGSDEIVKDLFENITGDGDTSEMRQTIMQQYRHVYESNGTRRASNDTGPRTRDLGNNISGDYESMIAPHSYPLNDTNVEKDWILSHCRTLGLGSNNENGLCPIGGTSDRIEKLLDSCFPSRLLKNNVVPINDLRPESSFNFRALMMPQRRYFSFRREGQLLARLCEKQAAALDSDDIHWTLGFTNSTFAGEFVESLVQSLYLCPMITGISFTRNSDWHMTVRENDADGDGDEGAGLLANLTGSLPPWVSHLTFDNMLNDRDLRALVVILDTMGKLSSGQEVILEEESQEDDDLGTPGAGGQGKFDTVSIRNSPEIARESWTSLFKMLGKSGPTKRGLSSLALSSLKVLDLSGNKLGDDMCALVLERCHDRDSGCSLEQLDLSGNRIGRGISVVKVLRSYTEYYRYNQKQGVKMVRSSWKSSLHTLLLAENDLFLGQAGLEIFDLLKHNALCLRFLDLSSNGLEGDTYQLMAGSILKNTSLCHLNLSGNKFGSSLVDRILDHLISKGTGCGLSFLLFENNNPGLNEVQRRKLGEFLKVSRKNAIERFVKERDEGHDTFEMPGLETFNEASNSNFLGTSFARRGSRMTAQEAETDSFGSGDSGENMITVLFSAPLVFADEENRLHPFAKLDFEMERELLWQCMKEASRDIEVSFDNAHHSRLLATLTKRCSCLHYSGHGHPHFLPFEDGMGGPNWLNVQDIKELIVRDGNAPFKFVFVSACHSGLAGETFASAGVPHVVCCQQESELKDTAALAFTRSFYLALAIGQTVQEAFEQGCKAVRATPNLRDPEKEMEKFVLLPRDGNHNVPVFNAKPVREWPKQPRSQLMSAKSSRRRGSLMRMRSIMTLGAKSSELSVRNMMQEDPSPTAPQFFLGREVDIYYILTAILKMRKRLVSVLGETGIGRSSLACALCHYINERASTITEIQRIYFIKPKHGGRNVSCRSLLKQLVDKLAEAGKNRPMDEDADTETILEWVCKSLKNDKALIVFDRTELLEKSDESQELPMVLSTLLYETKQVKVLLTGKHPLGQPSIGGQVEHPFHLGPLNVTNTVRLFVNLCPHLHTPSDRSKLFNRVVNACGEGADLLPGDPGMDACTKEILTLVGEGFPAKVEKAAYSISQDGLSRLRELAS